MPARVAISSVEAPWSPRGGKLDQRRVEDLLAADFLRLPFCGYHAP